MEGLISCAYIGIQLYFDDFLVASVLKLLRASEGWDAVMLRCTLIMGKIENFKICDFLVGEKSL